MKEPKEKGITQGWCFKGDKWKWVFGLSYFWNVGNVFINNVRERFFRYSISARDNRYYYKHRNGSWFFYWGGI